VRLSNFHGKNWLTFRQFAMEPEPVNVVVGAEGVGKTSLLRGLDWLFTGSADVLTTTKGDFNEVVGFNGSLDFSVGVRAVINKGGHAVVYDLEREQCGPSLSGQVFKVVIDGVPQAGSRVALEKQFYEQTAPRPVWWLLLNAWRFGNRDAAGVAALMTAITGGNVTPEEILAHAKTVVKAEDPKQQAKVDSLLAQWFARIPSPTNWDAAARWLDSQATTQRKMKKEYQAAIGTPGEPVDEKALAENRLKLGALKSQRDDILRNPGPTATEIEHLRAECGQNLLRDKTDDIEAAKAELAKLNPEDISAVTEKVRMTRVYEQLKGGAKCPTCTQEIPESLTKHFVKEIERLGVVAAKQVALATLEKHQADFDAAEVGRKRASQDLATAEAEAAKHKDRPAIPALEAEIARLSDTVFEAEAKLRATENAAKAKDLLASIDLTIEVITKLADVFKPEGMRSELAKHTGTFTTDVLNGFRYFTGCPAAAIDFGAATVTLDGDLAHKRSFTMLSDAQRAALGFAVSFAVGAQYGIWFAASDYFSELPPSFKQRVIRQFSKYFGEVRGTAFLMTAIPSDGGQADDYAMVDKAAEPGSTLFVIDRDHNVTRRNA